MFLSTVFVGPEFENFIAGELIGHLTSIFLRVLAIFICCIGSADPGHYHPKRSSEIGIRKVLGATVQQLLWLVTKEFLNLC